MTRLVLIIDADLYAVQRVYPENAEFKLAWSMLREGSETRTVMVKGDRTTCDCPDFVMRKSPMGLLCRHVDALEFVGLLPRRSE